MGQDSFGLVGSTIANKYRVDDVVAEGGFAILYRAFNLDLRMPVALKCLRVPPEIVGNERESFLERFLGEGQLLVRLSRGDAGIVQGYDAGHTVAPTGAWVPFLVLEWLEGQSLARDFGTRPEGRSLEDAMKCLEPAVEALDYAHHQGIAHRDIKPDNLFLAFVGGARTLKVVDFGIAKVVDDLARLSPGEKTIAGHPRAYTPAYAAPEQFDPGLGGTGPWTDVYALALVLVEAVCGKRATEGSTALDLRERALDPERRPTFSTLGLEVPDAVERVMARALAVDPRNRHESAGEFWKALRSAMGQSAVRPAAPAEAPPSVATETADVVDHRSPPSRTIAATRAHEPGVPRDRRRSVTVGAAALMVVGVGTAIVVVLIAWSSGTPEQLQVPSPTYDEMGVLPASQPHEPTPDPEMVRVPEGYYELGSPRGKSNRCEEPRRIFLNAFLIDRTEVTTGAYRRCVSAGACTSTQAHALESAGSRVLKGTEICNELRLDRGEIIADHPINCVDLFQAQAYCTFVDKRLPTSAEWEAAARGPAATEYPWGDSNPTCRDAVYATLIRHGTNRCQAVQGTQPVRFGRPSPFGAFGMAGNVWEFAAGTCPQSGRDSLLHGGGYDSKPDEPETLATWWHFPWVASRGGISAGFRCARSIRN